MATFRLLHASDLHVAVKQERVGLLDIRKAGLRFPRDYLGRRGKLALTSSYSPDPLAGLIKFVDNQSDPFDAVLLSGDLATTGKKEDLEQARSCIDGDADGLWYSGPSSGRQDFVSHEALKGSRRERTQREILLLPGNHDRYESPSFAPGGTLFDHYFGHYWEVGQRVKAWIFPPKDGAQLALVGADLTLRKGDQWADPLGSFGQGNAYADVIDELETLTDDLRADHPRLGLLWVVHFPPTYPKIDNLLRLMDEEILIEAAYRKRISHILAGHTHFPHAYTARSSNGSTVKVLCAGAAAQSDRNGTSFIHELQIEIGPEGTLSVAFQTYLWLEQPWTKRETDQQWFPVDCPRLP